MDKHQISGEQIQQASISEVSDSFKCDEHGLSSQEATERLALYGQNEIVEHKTSPILKFLKSFWGPITWMIEIAAALSAIIHHWDDFWIIFALLALMIVLLAILNDAPIIAIAYDNVRYSDTPDRWNMRTTLGIATFLGIIGVFSSFGIFFIGKELFHLGNEMLQSFIYLKLSVAGHLTVFVARTRGNFWSVRPALPLFLAVIITQLVATFITVYGIMLPAMGWNLALFVWGYALILFLVTDFLKVRMYGLLDHRAQIESDL